MIEELGEHPRTPGPRLMRRSQMYPRDSEYWRHTSQMPVVVETTRLSAALTAARPEPAPVTPMRQARRRLQRAG